MKTDRIPQSPGPSGNERQGPGSGGEQDFSGRMILLPLVKAHLFKRDNPQKNTNLFRRGIKIKLDMYGNSMRISPSSAGWCLVMSK